MVCRLLGTKSLQEPVLKYCQLSPWEQISVTIKSRYKIFHSWNECENGVWIVLHLVHNPLLTAPLGKDDREIVTEKFAKFYLNEELIKINIYVPVCIV